MKELFAGIYGDGALAPSKGVPLSHRAPPPREAVGGVAAFSPLDVLRAVARRPLLTLAVAAAAAGVLAFFVQKKLTPSFAAEALVSVSPIVPTVAYTGEEWRAQSIQGFYSDYVRTLVRLARAPKVASAAVATLARDGVDWLPVGVELEDAAAHLAARIDVRQVRDTQLLSVRFEDGSPDVVAPVANAIAHAMLGHVDELESARRESTRAALEGESMRLEAEISEVHRALETLAVPLGSPMADERHNIFFERVNALQESDAKALLALAQAESEQERAARLAEVRRDADIGAQVERLVDDDVAVRDERVMLGRLARDEDARTGHLSAEHPERRQGLERVAEATRRAAAAELDARERLGQRVRAERLDDASRTLAEARAGVSGAEVALARVRAELEAARAALRDHGRAMFEASRLRSRAGQALAALERLRERDEAVRTESNAQARVTFAEGAVRPRQAASDRRKSALVAALGLAVCASIVVAFAVDRFAAARA